MATDVWGISMVRDEADILPAVLAHMVAQVDRLLIADNGSTAGTAGILAAYRVDVVHDPDPAYRQSQKMTALAHQAREAGAEWVVPFDADELWTAPEGERIADYLTSLRDIDVAVATLYDHRTTDRDPRGADVVARMPWRLPQPGGLPKVACRTDPNLTIAQGNHDADYGRKDRRNYGGLIVHHYPYRSPEQFIRKSRNGSAAIAAADLPLSSGAHWRAYGRMTDDELVEHYWRWWHHQDTATLVWDPQ